MHCTTLKRTCAIPGRIQDSRHSEPLVSHVGMYIAAPSPFTHRPSPQGRGRRLRHACNLAVAARSGEEQALVRTFGSLSIGCTRQRRLATTTLELCCIVYTHTHKIFFLLPETARRWPRCSHSSVDTTPPCCRTRDMSGWVATSGSVAGVGSALSPPSPSRVPQLCSSSRSQSRRVGTTLAMTASDNVPNKVRTIHA